LLGNNFEPLPANYIDMNEKEKNAENQNNSTEIAELNETPSINTDENAAGTTHLNEPVSEESEMEQLRAEIQEQKDKYLRLMAEFDNFRRRTAKERLELIQTAGKDVIISLLDVLDDCDRAEKQMQATDDIKLVKEGVSLVFSKMRSSLQSKGVKEMKSVHEEFDVEKHEAITEIPAPNDELKGKVLDEVQKGYYLNEKLIRFAKVVVGK
jgi:molecular chaperone GrpE